MRSGIRKWQRRLAKDPKLSESESESWLYARSLAASPFERWMMNETYIRSLPSSVRSRLEKFGS
jgi:hypothetical protein